MLHKFYRDYIEGHLWTARMFVTAHPAKSVGIAFAAGFITARIF